MDFTTILSNLKVENLASKLPMKIFIDNMFYKLLTDQFVIDISIVNKSSNLLTDIVDILIVIKILKIINKIHP